MAELRLLLTGGHAGTTAIAVVQQVRKLKSTKDAEIYWAGSRSAILGKNIPTLESKALPKMGIKFYSIPTAKLQTKFTIYTIPSILMVPISFFWALASVLDIRPKVVFSFGGFSSFGIVFWSKILGIPVVVHEQTGAVGRAFRASAPFASRILLARKESKKYMNFGKVEPEIVGNPLMEEILSVSRKKELSKVPGVLIMGGSRGSNFLNELVYKIARRVLPSFRIIHITGVNDYSKANTFKQSLPAKLKDNYTVFESVEPWKMGEIYKMIDIAVSRSGANTVAELMYLNIPTLFIPLPRTHLSEQEKNARIAVEYGLGSVVLEKEAIPEKVLAEIDKLIKNWEKIVGRLQSKTSPDADASKKVAAIIASYC